MLAVVAIGSIGCRPSIVAFGPTPEAARANADAFFAALGDRFVNVQRAPRFAHARNRISRYALSPSKLYDDSTVWTSGGGDSARTLSLEGVFANERYLFAPRASVPLPDAPGDSRHIIELRRINEDEFRWTTEVLHAMGPARPADAAAAFSALLAAAEGRSEGQLRAGYRADFPRTTQALAQLFSLDSLRVSPHSEGTTAITLGIRIEPGRLRAAYPNFAKYVEKYIGPARYRIRLRDRRGATYLDVAADDDRVRIQLRERGGRLVRLDGIATPMPDTLELHIDASTRIKIFRVGVSNLVGDFVLTRDARERAWTMHFRREPDWHFPLAVRQFIRSPLRRPFEGEGVLFRLALRDAGSQTLLDRRLDFVVRESAIVRWLGGLGSGAMSDFAGKAEVEENKFFAGVMSSLRADAKELLAGD